MRRPLITAVLAGALAAAAALTLPALPAGAGTASPAAYESPASPAGPASPDRPAGAPECTPGQSNDGGGAHLGVDCPEQGGTTGGGTGGTNTGGGGGGGGRPRVDPDEACAGLDHWENCRDYVSTNNQTPDEMCGYVVAPDQSQLHVLHPDAPANATLLEWICPTGPMFAYQYVQEDTQWVVGDPAVVMPPTPAEVAAGLWASVQADLVTPTIQAWPPADVVVPVNTATFVSVTNWQGTQTDDDCDQGVCVTLTATPTLVLDAGDGSPEKVCPAGGTRYDQLPADDEPTDLARQDDICGHVYEDANTRRGAGRQAAWSGTVSIRWEATWEPVGAGPGGAFDPVVLAADLVRTVNEYPTAVTDLSPSPVGRD